MIAQLQIFAGGEIVMSTAQLASCLSMNPKVMSGMKQEMCFSPMEKRLGPKIIYTLDNVVRQLLSEYQVSLSPQAYVKAKVTHKKMRDQSAACCLNRLGLVKTGTANGVTGRGAVMHTR